MQKSQTISMSKGGSVSTSFTFDNITSGTTVSYSWSCNTVTSVLGNISDSGTHTVSTIPRYATCNQTLNSRTLNTVKVNWSSDSTIDYVWYSIGNGWVAVGSTNASSGSYTISGLSPATAYSIITKVRRKDSQLETQSDSLSVTTYDIAKITSAPNFNDEENPTIGYSNPFGSNVSSLQACISWTGGADIDYRDISKTGTSYTFNFTEEERNALRSAVTTSNSIKVIFHIRTIYNGTYYSTSEKTLTIVNANPEFENFTYKDTNTVVSNIVGSNQVFVKGVSTLRATISSGNKMVAKKEATAKNYTATIDNKTISENYKTTDVNIDIGTINSAGTKRLSIRAFDSRNNSTEVYKDIMIYDYTKPIINAEVARLNNFEAQTTLKITGTYSKLTIGDTDRNSITNIQYRYRETNGEWGEWTTLTPTIIDSNFSCNDVILNLDNTKSFEFEVQVIDKLQTSTTTLKIDVGQAIFFISSNKKTCYINGQEIVTHNTDKSIISDGTFNKGSWNEPNKGALTQIIDNSGAQHSAVVGLGKDGNRHYGIDLYDNYDSPEMRLYAGNHNLHLGLDGRIEYDGKVVGSKSIITVSVTNRPSKNFTKWMSEEVPMNNLLSNYGDAFRFEAPYIKTNRAVKIIAFGLVSVNSVNTESAIHIVSSQKGNLGRVFLPRHSDSAGTGVISSSLTSMADNLNKDDVLYMSYYMGIDGSQTFYSDNVGCLLTVLEV